jgi:hypothetical protein
MISLVDLSKLTWRDGKEAIDNIVTAVYDSQEINERDLQVASIACNHSLQHRDYLMGLPLRTGHAVAGYVVASIGEYATDNNMNDVPFMTICSMFAYEMGNNDMAERGLGLVLEADPDYSLALLLQRVMSASWPAETFHEMRSELHPKVIEKLDESADLPLVEE